MKSQPSLKTEIATMNEFGKKLIQRPTTPIQLLEKLALIGEKNDQKRIENFKKCNDISFAGTLIKVICC